MFQELNTKRKKQSFYITYGVFIINGMLALSIGSLMPYLREERGLTYAFCGILVSLHSCGNLVSSFVVGALPIRIVRRKTILIFQSFCILAYLFMLIGHHELMLILAFFLTGLARGASSNFNNMTINQLSPGSTWMINGLHSMFSLGAFAFPIILLCMTSKNAANWTFAVLFMIAAGVLSWFLYFMIPIEDEIIKKEEKTIQMQPDYCCKPKIKLKH